MAFEELFSEENRVLEEINACRIANRTVHLRFTAGEFCFTDGDVILVNPLMGNWYEKHRILYETECEMGFEPVFSEDEEMAARLMTRIQVIREALQVRFGDFEPRVTTDVNAYDVEAREALSTIREIIEDSYLDNVGCTQSKTIEQYLRFYRLFMKNLYLADWEKAGRQEPKDANEVLNLYLEYMAVYTLYPMVELKPAKCIADYVDKTKEFFLQGGITSNAAKRYGFTKEIFLVIRELLRSRKPEVPPKDFSGGGSVSNLEPDETTEQRTKTNHPEDGLEISRERLERVLGKSHTHSEAATKEPERKQHPERPEATGRLFGNREEPEAEYSDGINRMSVDLRDLNPRYDMIEESADAMDFGCSEKHKGILLRILRPRNYDGARDHYRMVYKKYHYLIATYRARIEEYLNAEQETRVDKCYIGTDIDSKRLGDQKGRYWYRRLVDQDMPPLSIIFMVDSSYSMHGERMKAVQEALILLHEVLKGQGMQYAIFGHTGRQSKPLVEHKIVMDFDAKDRDKYQIFLLDAVDGSREGVSLLWANDYLRKHAVNQDRLIIALSDGEPIHYAGVALSMGPPESIDDARACVKQIEKSGTKVIGIALDEGKSHCYDHLVQIYSHTVENKDLKLLPKQLLELITKELAGRRKS